MPPTAFATQDYSVLDMWSGEVIDVAINWTPRMNYSAGASATYAHTATGANGSGWTAVGQTASSFTWYVPAGLSAGVSATGIYYSAYLALSGSSSASSSSLTAVHTMLRLAATGLSAAGAISARLLTSSGQEFRAVWTARIQG